MNESFSDVFATGFEFFANNAYDKPDFFIGGEIMKNRPYRRNMTLPRKMGDAQWVDPANMSLDRGGAHLNSAIPNYLFYKCVMDVGLDRIHKVLSLWYRVYCRLPKVFGKRCPGGGQCLPRAQPHSLT